MPSNLYQPQTLKLENDNDIHMQHSAVGYT